MHPNREPNRRTLVKGLGAAGLMAANLDAVEAGQIEAKAAAVSKPAGQEAVPTRKLGRNGPLVPMISMGGDMEPNNALTLMNRAWASGYRYYDTAQKYGRAAEEEIYRKWFAANPGRREQIFLVSKDYPTKKGPIELLDMIDVRLKALGTDYLDLYFIHQLCPEVYGPESVNWGKSDVFREVAEKLKKSGKVRMVGFSCHGGPEYIQAAADGGFLDALMVQYSPFYERGGSFDKALTDCHAKGIGLIAMKTLRHAGNVPKRIPEFEKLGLTTHQAILHAVWSDQRIASICNSVRNFDQMRSSLAAVRNYKAPLEVSLVEKLRETVLASRRTMCPGCPSCDEKVAATKFAFRDIARYVTYFEQDINHQARDRYLSLPESARKATSAELAELTNGCSYGIDYAEVAARAERYFA
ncbi:aldo/keto reductase [bacterium]|nr:aldo/keto reductase [bacterium]